MPFAYYAKLSRAQKRIYRASDDIQRIAIPRAEHLHPAVAAVEEALTAEDRRVLAKASQKLSDALFESLGVPRVKIRVLSKRPSKSWGEIHGLYEPTNDGTTPRITVWMRTAQRKQVVAFKTFLRTLIHEWLHHLDYEHLELEDSFHTQGFYQRESDVFRQLAPGLARRRARPKPGPAKAKPVKAQPVKKRPAKPAKVARKPRPTAAAASPRPVPREALSQTELPF